MRKNELENTTERESQNGRQDGRRVLGTRDRAHEFLESKFHVKRAPNDNNSQKARGARAVREKRVPSNELSEDRERVNTSRKMHFIQKEEIGNTLRDEIRNLSLAR